MTKPTETKLPVKRKLSEAQYRSLRGVRDGGEPWFYCHGGASFGGTEKTVRFLRKHDLVKCVRGKWSLTPAGKAALK